MASIARVEQLAIKPKQGGQTMGVAEIDRWKEERLKFGGEEVTCPNCSGSGVLEGAYTPGYPGNLPTQECGCCLGKGKVPRNKASAYYVR